MLVNVYVFLCIEEFFLNGEFLCLIMFVIIFCEGMVYLILFGLMKFIFFVLFLCLR